MIVHKIFVISIVFTVFIEAFLLQLNLINTKYEYLILSYSIIIIYLIKNIFNIKLKLEVLIIGSILLTSACYYFFITTINFGLLSGLAVIKTFFFIPLIILFFSCCKSSHKTRENFFYFMNYLLIFISVYSILEWLIRIYYPTLYYATIVNYVLEPTKNAGINYLAFGDGFILQSLGIFQDSFSDKAVAVIACIWGFVEKKKTLFITSFISLFISLNMTCWITFLISISVLLLSLNTILIIIPFGLLFMYILIYYLQKNTFSILFNHLLEKIDLLFIDGLVLSFGKGYDKKYQHSEILGYNEIFIYEFIYSFGLIGVMLLSFFPYYLFKSMTSSSKKYASYSLALIITIPLFLFHYNLFFQPFILFLYCFIAYRISYINKTLEQRTI